MQVSLKYSVYLVERPTPFLAAAADRIASSTVVVVVVTATEGGVALPVVRAIQPVEHYARPKVGYFNLFRFPKCDVSSWRRC